MALDDIAIKLKALLELNSDQANRDVDAFVNSAQQRLNSLRARIEIDQSELEQFRRILNRTREQVRTQFTIPVAVDQRSFETFQAQLNRYRQQITEAGGVIQRSDLTPVIRTRVLEDGTEQVTETYRAVITFQTAVGETVQRIVELDTATGEINESMGRMSTNFAQQRKEANNLSSAIDQYTAKLNALREKSRAILNGTAGTNSFRALIESIDFSHVGNMEELNTMINRLKQAQAEFDRLNASITNKKLAGTSIEQINQNLERIPDRIAEIRSRFSDIQMPDTIRQQLEAVEQQLENIRNIEAPDQFIAAYNQITQVLDTIPSKLKVIQAEQKQMTQNALEQQRAQDRLNSLIARYQASATRYSAFKSDSSLLTEYRALGNTIEQLQQRLQQVKQTGVWDKSLTADIASANAQMSQFNNHVVMAGKNAKSLKDTFKEAFSTFGTWLSATSIIMKLIQGVRNAITAVKDLDAAMVNLKKVTNETDQAYTEYLKNVGKQAQRIGATMTDLIESGATFAKLGYSFKESQGLAEVATIFANVGDFNNINTATNGLITAMKSFNIAADDAMSIADKINEVANRFAVSADDLTTGLANSASALNLAGNTIDQTIAMITAMSEITQNASESGNALKILSMRLRGAKAELQTAGEETDGMCESTAKLREKILALTDGVDIMADEAGTQFKSTYQIMQEIAAVWNDLTDINQAALLETIAGKLRGNSISALLTNMAQANKVLETSLDSAGSALNEHEKWLESIAAKEAQMKAAWEDFSDSVVSTDAIKGWYDGLTGLLNILTQIIDKVGSIPALLGAVYAGFSLNNKGLFGSAKNSNGEIIGRIGRGTYDDFVNGGLGTGLLSIIGGSLDTAVIDDYFKSIDAGVDTVNALQAALTNTDGSMKKLNLTTRMQMQALGVDKVAMQQLGVATVGQTAKTVMLTAAQTALNAVLNIGFGILVSLAANAVIGWISDAINGVTEQTKKIDELKEKISSLQEDYQSIQSEIGNVNDELTDTQKRIDELNAKDKLTFVEKQELEDLNKTNESLSQRIKYLERLQELKSKDLRDSVAEKYKADMLDSSEYAQSFATKVGDKNYFEALLSADLTDFVGSGAIGNGKGSEIDEIHRRVSEYRLLTQQGYADYALWKNQFDLVSAELSNAIAQGDQEAIQLYQAKQESAQRDLDNAQLYLDNEKYLLEAYDKLSGYLDDYGDVDDDFTQSIRGELERIDRVLDPAKYKTKNFNEIIGLVQYKEAVSEIQALAKDGVLTADSIAQYSELSESLLALGFTMDEIIEQFYSMADAERTAANEASSFENTNARVQGIFEAQAKLAEISQKQSYSASITEEQYKEIIALGDDYAKCIENVNGYVALNIDKVNQLVQAKYEEEKATLAVNKAQALEKYAENTTAIKIKQETLKLLDNEYYRAQEGYAEWVKQLQTGISLLESDNSRLFEEIAGYERLASQLDYATSAYKKWLDAQNAPEAGEAYDNLRVAMKQIEEGRESGKIGTAKYKAAVELLVPDGRDVDSYMQTLGRYLTEDSTGLQNFIDDMYKRANPFLSKDANGRYSFMKGTTVEDIAQGLGLTNEVAEYMLTALKDYGWKVDFVDNKYTSTDTIQQYQEAVDAVKAAQEELNALISEGASTEQIEAAKQKVEELEQALEEIEAPEIELSLEEQLQAKIAEIQAMINEMEALKIPIEGVIGHYDDTQSNKAELLSAMVAFVSAYQDSPSGVNTSGLVTTFSALVSAYTDSSGGVDVSGLVTMFTVLASAYKDASTVDTSGLTTVFTALASAYKDASGVVDTTGLTTTFTALVAAYTDANGAIDVSGLVTTFTAFANAYTDASGNVDTSGLSTAFTAIVSAYKDASGNVDTAGLTTAFTALVSAYKDKSGQVDTSGLISTFTAFVAAYTDATGKVDTSGCTTAITAYVNALQDSPNGVVSNLTIPEIVGYFSTNEQQVDSELGNLQQHIDDNAPTIVPKLVAPTREQLKAEYEALQKEYDNYNPETDGVWKYGSRTPEMVYQNNLHYWGYDEEDNALEQAAEALQDAADSLQEAATPSPQTTPGPQNTPIPQGTPVPQSSYDKLTAFGIELKNTGGDFNASIQNLATSWEEVREAYIEYKNSIGEPLDLSIGTDQIDLELTEWLEKWTGIQLIFGLNADPSNATKTANNAKTKIDNMTATMTINGKYGSILGGLLGGYPKLAKGTHFAKEEDAIVGESGIETWIHDGKFYTVGHNGAELVHLSRGDQVLNPGETRALFKGKQISGNAYGDGIGGTNLLGSIIDAGKNLASGIWNGLKNLLDKGKNNTTTDVGSDGSDGGKDTGGKKDDKGKGGNGGGNNKKKQDEEYLKSLENLVDWIPTALENLKKKTDEYIDYADKAVGYMLKNANLDNAIKNIDDEINLNLQGYEKYMQQANEIAQRMNLSDDIVNKIQNGTIDIESYDEDTRKVITAYQKWYDLANGCRDAVGDLRKQQTELAKQKLDNIAKDYENRISLLGTIYEGYQKQIDKKIASGKEVTKSDYSDMLTNTQERIDMLQQERDAMSNELQSLVDAGTIQEGSDDWYKYTNQIKEFDSAIADAEISMEDLKDSINGITLTNIQTAMSMLNQIHSTIQGFMDLRSAQGKTATAGDYRDLISSGSKQIKNLEMQNAALLKQQEGLDVLSEKYQEIQKQINENALAILSTKAKQEEWNDAIIDLEIERLQKQNTQYKSQLQLMDAIENLEKSKQRRALVYREGGHSAP